MIARLVASFKNDANRDLGMTPVASRFVRPLSVLLLAVGFAATAQAEITVGITSPSEGALLVAGSNTVSASAASPDGIFSVQFFVDGVSVGIDLNAPYSKAVTLDAGTHVLTALATDACCGVTKTSAPVTVTVTDAPTVSITAPAGGTTLMAPASFALAATAADADGYVQSVAFYANGVLLSTDTTAPYTATYNSSTVGTHALTAVAKDNLNITKTSAAVSVTVTATNTAPALTITAPANGAVITGPANVAFTATASDTGGSVTKVDFYAGAALIGTDTTSPYAANFAAVAQGVHTLKAIATDNLGATTQKTVSVTVNAPMSVTATRNYVYDANQRLCLLIEPESGATVMQYDAAGNLLWAATGQTPPAAPYDLADCTAMRGSSAVLAARIDRTYDARNRLKTVTVPGIGDDASYEYYADGALKKLTNGTSVWDYGYNLRRLPVTETLAYGGLTRTLTHAYNANGFEATLTYPSGLAVQFAPNALGQPTQAGSSFATLVTYHPNGGMASFKYNACQSAACITHTMVQNERKLPAQVTDSNVAAGGTVTPIKDTYVYDANGNVLSITDTSTGGYGRTRDQMAYDGLDRLLFARAQGQAWASATTTYDALDNIRKNIVGSRSRTYNYNAANQLASYDEKIGTGTPANRTVHHDANGNIDQNHLAGYVYDGANRMLQATGKETYAYDGHGRRVEMKRTTDAKSSYPFYSLAGQLIADHDTRPATPIATEYVYLNGSMVVKRTNTIGQVNYSSKMVYTDALGSPIAESSSAATITRLENYTPYGEVTDGVYDQGPGFTSHTTDAATGLSYMQQRHYDPSIGRFLSVDPVTANGNTGAMFNRYNYANNNPYKFVDPDGRTCTSNDDKKGVTCKYDNPNGLSGKKLDAANRAYTRAVNRLLNDPNRKVFLSAGSSTGSRINATTTTGKIADTLIKATVTYGGNSPSIPSLNGGTANAQTFVRAGGVEIKMYAGGLGRSEAAQGQTFIHEGAHGTAEGVNLQNASSAHDFLRIFTRAPNFNESHQGSFKSEATRLFNNYDN